MKRELRIGQATCPHCGYVTTTGGISTHVRHCSKNPNAIYEKRRKAEPTEVPFNQLPKHLQEILSPPHPQEPFAWQLCPKCNGSGRAMNYDNICPSYLDQCDVCKGEKIIQRPLPVLPPLDAKEAIIAPVGEVCGHEQMFSQTQIEHFQHEVYKLTGKGEVMQLFNKLLGVSAGLINSLSSEIQLLKDENEKLKNIN